jgi:hypothetical protein
VVPLIAAEVQGYLKHCIRAVGGDFDAIFDPAATDMLYRCSEGVPRVLNNLCESVLAAAAEAGADLVMPQLVQYVANEEFGLQPTLPPGSRSRTARKPDRDIEATPPHTATPPKPTAEAKPPAAAPTNAIINPEPPIAGFVTTEFEPIPVVTFTPEPKVGRPVDVESAVPSAMTVDAPKQTIAIAPPVVADNTKAAIAVAPTRVVDAAKPAVAVQPKATIADVPKPTVALPPSIVTNAAKPAVAVPPPSIATNAAKPAVAVLPPAIVADAPKPKIAVTPATVADIPEPAITAVTAAVPDELPLEHIRN